MANNHAKSTRTTSGSVSRITAAAANIVPVGDITGGVDTHRDFHVAAARDGVGRLLGTARFPACAAGYAALLDWLCGFGPVVLVGVEGTGSYGAGLTRHLIAHDVAVVEVNRPDRQKRRRQGKSDPTDAICAATAAQSGQATAAPKLRTGPVESVRVLQELHDQLTKARTAALNTLHALILTAPEDLRASLRDLSTTALLTTCATFLTNDTTPDLPTPGLRGKNRVQAQQRLAQALLDPQAATQLVLGQQARIIANYDARLTEIDTCIRTLVSHIAPRTSGAFGVGPGRAARLLITIGDHPDRIHSEAAMAALTGVAPQDCSSGQQQHHRLSRAGDRRANSVLYYIIITRLASHQPTRTYMTERLTQGKKMTKKHLIRCLKRYLVRELFPLLRADLTNPTTTTQTA